MANFSPLIDELIEALRCLPGVGAKSAQRISFQLLERNRGGAQRLSLALQQAVDKVGHCRSCRTLSEDTECRICRDPRRDQHTICVVESPADVVAFEQGGDYRGLYFVLMGRLSPIDGIGPEEIGIDRLVERVQALAVSELILATNPTVEGEATAFYIAEEMRRLGVAVSRIAHGVPLGGELEYVDSGTLSHALKGRQRFD